MDLKNIFENSVLVIVLICALCDKTTAFQNDIKGQEIFKWSTNTKPISSKEHDFKSSLNNSNSSEEDFLVIEDSNNQRPFKDNIEFREAKGQSQQVTSRIRSNVFFTKAQTRDHVAIHYPNVPTNPNNRLQLEPDDAATLPSVIATATPKTRGSYEDFNFFDAAEDKKKFSYRPNQTGTLEIIRSMDVTLDIVRHSFWDDQNIIFSPMSVCNILALLMLGAEGRTYDELASVLRVKALGEPMDPEKDLRFHQSFHKLIKYLTKKPSSIEMASQIFANKNFHLESSYESESQKFYETPVKSFNFGTEGKYFKDEVNKWVLEKTNGQIKSIVDEPPPSDTTLALVNAVYFKGDWETPFIEKITRKSHFHVKKNETIHVQMMTNVITIPYFENEDYQMIAIPYKGNKMGFFVLLPKASNGIEGLKHLERRLSVVQPKDLEARLNQMQLQKVAVKIPKMKITTDGHMEEILSNMGIPSMFEPHLANFSKISPDGGLFVSKILHRAMIEVNERGTEAAAVTLATGDRIIEDPPIPFNANKPFMFFISHIQARAVLFWGRVTRPVWA